MVEILDLAMFAFACIFLMLGFPVAFTLAGTGLIFALIALSLGLFDMSIFGALPSRIYGNAMTNEVLIAVPLFVFMGVMLERTGESLRYSLFSRIVHLGVKLLMKRGEPTIEIAAHGYPARQPQHAHHRIKIVIEHCGEFWVLRLEHHFLTSRLDPRTMHLR